MTATTIFRHLARPHALRLSRSTLHARTYATPTHPQEEIDPQLNGYPQLPFVSSQHLPALGWQDQLMRRNFGDTLHEQDEVLSMWGPDIPPLAPQRAAFHFALALTGFIGVGFLIKNVLVPDTPAVRREYPFSGLVTELGGLEENQARAESESEEA